MMVVLRVRRVMPVLVLVALVAGCGGEGSVAPEPPTASSDAVAPATPSATLPAGCRVYLPAAVSRSLRTQWARPRPGQILPFDNNSGDGPWIAAQVDSDGFHGVGLFNLDTNEVREVDRFADDQRSVAGVYDGSVAVWTEYHSTYLAGDYVVKVWHADSRRVRVVGRTPEGARFGTTTASAPVLGDGYAAWTEGTFKGLARLVLLDLATGRTSVVATGHPSAPLIRAGQLVWREGAALDGPFTTHAWSLQDGHAVAPPGSLVGHAEKLTPVTDGRAIAWLEGDGDKGAVYYSSDGTEEPRRLLVFDVGGFGLTMREGVVITDYRDGVIAVDADGASATVALGGGSAFVGGGGFVLAGPNVDKSADWPRGLAVVKPRDLDLPACD